MWYILGQICGLLSTVLTVVLPFFRKKWQILLANVGINLLVASNMVLIGQMGSAVFLCLVAVVQSVISMVHDNKGTAAGLVEKILFMALYVGFGFFGIVTAPGFVPAITWANVLELLPIVGALMMMFSVFAKETQTMRKFLLVNAIVWTVYTGCVGSTVFFTDLTSAVSSMAALYKYRKKAAAQ